MNAEEYNAIAFGTVTTTPGPIGGPSNTPAPTGTNDPSATTDPGSGTGAPTPMPKQDSGSNFVNLGNEVRSARQVVVEARLRLDAADTVLNQLAAELRAMAQNPADRQLRFAQEAFFPMLLTMIAQAKDLIGTDPQANQTAIRMLTQAEWIVGKIRQI